MKMNKIAIPILAVAVVTVLFFGFSFGGSQNVAYVDNAELFNDYKGKLEKEALIKTVESKYQTQLDSIELELKSFAGLDLEKDASTAKSYQSKVEYYNNLKKEIAYKTGSDRERYSDEIWNQINQYVRDFGDKYDYDLILGALGNGSLMYGKEHVDITEEVLVYINNRYEGHE